MERMRSALETNLAASAQVLDDRHAAHTELCRLLADQMDSAGPNPSTRLSAAYLSGLKDLARLQSNTVPVKKTGKLVALRAER